jgi:hypothetical protein
MINPLGFTLENYDAVGRYRDKENGQPVDASGWYVGLSGDKAQLRGPRELAEFLAASDETSRSFVRQLFHHVVKQPVAAYGPHQLEELEQQFAAADYSIRGLLVEIMKATALKTTSSFNPQPQARHRSSSPAETAEIMAFGRRARPCRKGSGVFFGLTGCLMVGSLAEKDPRSPWVGCPR